MHITRAIQHIPSKRTLFLHNLRTWKKFHIGCQKIEWYRKINRYWLVIYENNQVTNIFISLLKICSFERLLTWRQNKRMREGLLANVNNSRNWEPVFGGERSKEQHDTSRTYLNIVISRYYLQSVRIDTSTILHLRILMRWKSKCLDKPTRYSSKNLKSQ